MSAAALLVMLALGPGRIFEVAGVGTIVPGSIVQTGPSEHRLKLQHVFALDGEWPRDGRIDVVVLGRLPDTVCDRTLVYVSGTRTATAVITTALQAVPGRYDRCFQLQCHPDAYDACRGIPPFK